MLTEFPRRSPAEVPVLTEPTDFSIGFTRNHRAKSFPIFIFKSKVTSLILFSCNGDEEVTPTSVGVHLLIQSGISNKANENVKTLGRSTD